MRQNSAPVDITTGGRSDPIKMQMPLVDASIDDHHFGLSTFHTLSRKLAFKRGKLEFEDPTPKPCWGESVPTTLKNSIKKWVIEWIIQLSCHYKCFITSDPLSSKWQREASSIYFLKIIRFLLQNLPAMQESQETQVQSLGWEDHLDEGLATHCSILAWRIPWTEEPGGLQSTGLQRIGRAWRDLACTRIKIHKPIASVITKYTIATKTEENCWYLRCSDKSFIIQPLFISFLNS